ncbi:MAG: amidohydrolase family protein [Opitutaceae bacterium]
MQNPSAATAVTPPPSACACVGPPFSRRGFLIGAAAATLAYRASGAVGQKSGDDARDAAGGLPIIDIHVHCTHRNRPDEQILVHQQATGVKATVLLPAGETGGLAADAAGNAHVVAFARRFPGRFFYFANENVFRPNATREIERYLKGGAIGIGELKDKGACDSPDMQRIAEVARDYDVPMLIHFQDRAYNDGYGRFHRMLEKYPTVKFIGHAQTFWANIDKNHQAAGGLYPKGPVVPGGLTDRWLADYPNLYGDLAAGSGNNALVRDPEFTRGFLVRHQDKLLYGSDCFCATGAGPQCHAAAKLGFLKELCPAEDIRKKLLSGNARKLLKLPARSA